MALGNAQNITLHTLGQGGNCAVGFQSGPNLSPNAKNCISIRNRVKKRNANKFKGRRERINECIASSFNLWDNTNRKSFTLQYLFVDNYLIVSTPNSFDNNITIHLINNK